MWGSLRKVVKEAHGLNVCYGSHLIWHLKNTENKPSPSVWSHPPLFYVNSLPWNNPRANQLARWCFLFLFFFLNKKLPSVLYHPPTIVCSFHINAKMFDYILLPAPLQPLTKRRHRINCVKIVLPLQPHPCWILNAYWRESSCVYFLKMSWRAITLLLQRSHTKFGFPTPKITETFADSHMAEKEEEMECKAFLSFVGGSWALK